ncbi:ABC transporter substrate-binding protein [Wukongibacter sp. M2B1]|uniref:ABC transporter substrate-binding protein n=1 Tax=Wukongibacter sp. M2B1 TaxID=3088895 RepID=UPI003D7BAC1E
MKKLCLAMVLVLMFSFLLMGCTKEEPVKQEEPKSEASNNESVDNKTDEPTEFVVSTWGYNEDKLRKNIFEPFEKANNVKIVLEVGNNADRLNKIRVSENSKIDVIFLANSFAIQGVSEGLFEEINRDNIPNLNQIYDLAKAPLGEKYGPAYTLNRTGIVYDSDMVDKKIESWKDLWNKEFESNASIPEITTTAGPSMVIMAANTVGADALEDSDKAFEALGKLKPNLVKTYGKSSEIVNMFAQGEIAVAAVQDFAFGRIKDAVPTAEWVDPQDGAFANLNTINIVKGTKNKEIAEKFIDWCLSEEVQKANAIDKVDSPVNVNVKLSEEEAEGLTYGKELINSLKVVDWVKVNELKTDWIDRWNREVIN